MINTNLRNNKKNNKSNHKELCRQQTGKKVYCVEIDKKFISISEASEYFNVSSTTIRNYLQLNKKLNNNYTLKSIC